MCTRVLIATAPTVSGTASAAVNSRLRRPPRWAVAKPSPQRTATKATGPATCSNAHKGVIRPLPAPGC